MAGRREYPERPMVGVGGVVIRDTGVLLVQRASEPLAGQWSLPGGAVGQKNKETGFRVRVVKLLEAFERIIRDDSGRPRYHYVLLDYLCEPVEGSARPGSDVQAVAWATPEEFDRYALSEKARAVCRKAFALAGRG